MALFKIPHARGPALTPGDGAPTVRRHRNGADRGIVFVTLDSVIGVKGRALINPQYPSSTWEWPDLRSHTCRVLPQPPEMARRPSGVTAMAVTPVCPSRTGE